MATEGAASPPLGVVPDFKNPPEGVHFWTKITQLLCIPIVTAFVVMRMYVKIYLRHEFHVEDWACLVAWV